MLRIMIVFIMLVLMFPPCSVGEEDVIIAVASEVLILNFLELIENGG